MSLHFLRKVRKQKAEQNRTVHANQNGSVHQHSLCDSLLTLFVLLDEWERPPVFCSTKCSHSSERFIVFVCPSGTESLLSSDSAFCGPFYRLFFFRFLPMRCNGRTTLASSYQRRTQKLRATGNYSSRNMSNVTVSHVQSRKTIGPWHWTTISMTLTLVKAKLSTIQTVKATLGGYEVRIIA